MSQQLRFDGKVAIVTGAGNGLGRAHALLLGSRGAKVVVNDLGVNLEGVGMSSAAADAVVAEIRAMGGEAVADYNSVADAQNIVKTALDAFGTVDILINNAGILRDVSFAKMTEEQWDIIQEIHVKAAFKLTHLVWPIMREKSYGRIIMTASGSGIHGNFGQANYSAAKGALISLGKTLAFEGGQKNIRVNTIAPVAASRLVVASGILPEEVQAKLQSEYIAPLVAWLCHEDCPETGGLFEVGGGFHAKYRWERSQGRVLHAESLSPELVRENWERITQFDEHSVHQSNGGEGFQELFARLESPAKGGNQYVDMEVAANAVSYLETEYDQNDAALYALAVGAAKDPLDETELLYINEFKDEEFRVLPTMAVLPATQVFLQAIKSGKPSLEGLELPFANGLHGEQYTEMYRPLPPAAKLKHTMRLKQAIDKGRSSVSILAVETTDENGVPLFYNEITSFYAGVPGAGLEKVPSTPLPELPSRNPDAVIAEQTDVNQALLYRLCGDWNPMHVDPDYAKAAGYEKPFLHGLCTFGYAGRHVIKAFCNNDSRLFKSIRVRFASIVMPGDTLETRMWQESPTRVLFEMRAVERDVVVLKGGVVEIFDKVPDIKSLTEASKEEPKTLTADDVFGVYKAHLQAHPEIATESQMIMQFVVKNRDSNWVLDLKNGKGDLYQGIAENADVTMTIQEVNMPELASGEEPQLQKLFFAGKLKLTGDTMASKKLEAFANIDQKLYAAATAERLSKAANPA
ncbi:SDR family NAD(P)-dependent oxidoreductase [Pseudomonas sp. GD03860]|nr:MULTISPECIES: peroxisomal multifunctional enzyme type 2 [Pseudomonas]MDD2058549.1 SDR family NAD(P)-dependent oxidoreductase [Pseudomonas putida]MDH0640731.1 SDR family NAD(P)-dependent oxidoreductase [Pseudomonas sp. GD03860]